MNKIKKDSANSNSVSKSSINKKFVTLQNILPNYRLVSFKNKSYIFEFKLFNFSIAAVSFGFVEK